MLHVCIQLPEALGMRIYCCAEGNNLLQARMRWLCIQYVIQSLPVEATMTPKHTKHSLPTFREQAAAEEHVKVGIGHTFVAAARALLHASLAAHAVTVS